MEEVSRIEDELFPTLKLAGNISDNACNQVLEAILEKAKGKRHNYTIHTVFSATSNGRPIVHISPPMALPDVFAEYPVAAMEFTLGDGIDKVEFEQAYKAFQAAAFDGTHNLLLDVIKSAITDESAAADTSGGTENDEKHDGEPIGEESSKSTKELYFAHLADVVAVEMKRSPESETLEIVEHPVGEDTRVVRLLPSDRRENKDFYNHGNLCEPLLSSRVILTEEKKLPSTKFEDGD